jgi:glutamate racemase
MIRIGVFDSGMGGKSVANAVTKALPDASVTFVSDTENLPYGSKTPDQLYAIVLPILQKLATSSDVIVIACNTVTTTLIDRLRAVITTPLVAVEPMVKPAAEQTKTGVIAVCATPTTLASARYRELKDTYAQGITVIEPDCSQWTRMIESNNLDKTHVTDSIQAACQAGADVIVLGCTHYHWIEDLIRLAAGPGVTVIQPEPAVVRQLTKVISEL